MSHPSCTFSQSASRNESDADRFLASLLYFHFCSKYRNVDLLGISPRPAPQTFAPIKITTTAAKVYIDKKKGAETITGFSARKKFVGCIRSTVYNNTDLKDIIVV